MKYFKSKISILFILVSLTVFGQKDTQNVKVIKDDSQVEELFETFGKDEIKIDILDIISLPAFTIGYERISNSYNSYGVELFFNFNDNSAVSGASYEKFFLSPYYRFYFFKKMDYGGAGGFVEVFTKFTSGEHQNDYYDTAYRTEQNNFFDIAVGAGVGKKWVNKSGMTFEFLFGVGRFLIMKDSSNDYSNNDDQYYSYNDRSPISTKINFSIGKRF